MNTNLFTQLTSPNGGLLWRIFCLQLVVSRLCCDSLDIYPSAYCVAKEMPQNHFKLTWGTFHIFHYALSWRLLLYNLIWRLLNLGHWAFKKDFSSAWRAWHCTIMWKSLDQLTKIGQLHEEHQSLPLLEQNVLSSIKNILEKKSEIFSYLLHLNKRVWIQGIS